MLLLLFTARTIVINGANLSFANLEKGKFKAADLRRANFNLFCQQFKEYGFEELNFLQQDKGFKDFRDGLTCKFNFAKFRFLSN